MASLSLHLPLLLVSQHCMHRCVHIYSTYVAFYFCWYYKWGASIFRSLGALQPSVCGEASTTSWGCTYGGLINQWDRPGIPSSARISPAWAHNSTADVKRLPRRTLELLAALGGSRCAWRKVLEKIKPHKRAEHVLLKMKTSDNCPAIVYCFLLSFSKW